MKNILLDVIGTQVSEERLDCLSGSKTWKMFLKRKGAYPRPIILELSESEGQVSAFF